jgi:hypothetical protein
MNFNLYLESKKIELGYDTYLETLSWFMENESDQEPEQIAKCLNKKITEEITKEANELGMLKNHEISISLL